VHLICNSQGQQLINSYWFGGAFFSWSKREPMNHRVCRQLDFIGFQAPVPVQSWQGVKDATKPHNICPQRDIYRRSTVIEGNEDCLYLNVYTPQVRIYCDKLIKVLINKKYLLKSSKFLQIRQTITTYFNYTVQCKENRISLRLDKTLHWP
jgi:hypothetical protein